MIALFAVALWFTVTTETVLQLVELPGRRFENELRSYSPT